MIRPRSLVAIATALSLLGLSPALAGAQTIASNDSSMSSPGARFGGSVNPGAPNLANTLSLVIAGGGPKNFSTVTLFGVLAGDKAKAEEDALTKQYGADKFGQFIKTFDFVINDSLKIVTEDKVQLPSKPDPLPTDGKALAAALYTDGLDKDHGFNVEFMLDSLVTHPIHVQVMKDIDAKYGEQADADYHVVLTKVMKDLKAVYGL